jgi:spermidine synthase
MDINLFIVSSVSLMLELIICMLFKIDYNLAAFLMIIIIASAIFGLGVGATIVFMSRKLFSACNLHALIYLFLLALAPIVLLLYLRLSFSMRIVVVTILFSNIGIITTLIFQYAGLSMFRLYFFNFLGAGLGVVSAPALFKYVGLEGALWINLILIFMLVIFNMIKTKRKLVFIPIFGIAGLIFFSPGLTAPLPLKTLKKTEFAEKVALTKWNQFSRIDVTRQKVPIERTLAKSYVGEYALGYYILIDGLGLVENRFQPYSTILADFENTEALKHELTYLPNCLLTDNSKVLIVGSGGGTNVFALNLSPGGKEITAVEMNPLIVDVLKKYYNLTYKSVYIRNNVNLVIDEIRAFLSMTKEKYDSIQLHHITNQVSLFLSSAHSFQLEKNYLYTIDALNAYFNHLKKNGFIVITFRNKHEFFLSILKNAELILRKVSDKFVMIGNGSYSTLILKQSAFSRQEIKEIKQKAREEGFNVIYPSAKSNYISEYISDREPERFKSIVGTTDDRPFCTTYFPKTFSNAVNILILVTVLFCILLFSLKIYLVKERRAYAVGVFLYFFCLGVAYILIETFLFQKMAFFIGQPIYGFSVVAASLLVFNGIGSLMFINKMFVDIRNIFFMLFIMCLIYFIAQPYLITHLMSNTLFLRVIFSILITAPLGCLMGIPFPYGLEKIKKTQHLIPYAFSINALSTVLGMLASITICVRYGYSILVLIGGFIYFILYIIRKMGIM